MYARQAGLRRATLVTAIMAAIGVGGSLTIAAAVAAQAESGTPAVTTDHGGSGDPGSTQDRSTQDRSTQDRAPGLRPGSGQPHARSGGS